MKYIKSLAVCLLATFALVACNDNFEEGTPITYPDKIDLGIWQNEYTATGGMSYTVNLTLNEQGDTVLDVTTLNTANNRANVLSHGKVKYNKLTGVLTAEYEESPYESPARVTIAFKNDLKSMTVNLYAIVDGKLSDKGFFTAVAGGAISYLGDWMLPDGRIMSLNADKSVVVGEGDDLVKGSFEQTDNGVTATFGSEKAVLSTNAKGQTYVQLNNAEPAYVTHITTQPKNDWYEYAIGNYISWLFASDGKGNEYPYECVLEYSPSREMARISGWLEQLTPQDLTFYWVIGEPSVTMGEKQFATSYTHVQDGQTLGEVYAMPVAIDEEGNTAVFEDNIFYFGMQYAIPGVGAFGANIDRYEITDILAAE